jgi:hypothetical protein
VAESLGRRAAQVVDGAGAVLIYALFRICRWTPPRCRAASSRAASAPSSPSPPRGSRKLRRALPEISQTQGRLVICSMWDNLDRVMAEYPHLGKDHAYVGRREHSCPGGAGQARHLLLRSFSAIARSRPAPPTTRSSIGA